MIGANALFLGVLLARAACVTEPGGAALTGPEARTFDFTYEATITPPEGASGPVDVFVPVAQDDPQQVILSMKATTSIPGEVGLEEAHGNRFWHGHVGAGDATPVTVRFEYRVRRLPVERAKSLSAPAAPRDLSRRDAAAKSPWLEPDAHVPVGDPVLKPILDEIHRTARGKGKAALARSMYDWLVDHLEYKKTGTGWGQGDVYWACSERYGNCTDFHSLFDALARTEGMPARFDIGFPIPRDKPEGTIGGYHCWTWVDLAGSGWVPLDASEASKDKARREELWGALPADRVRFTTGRDLTLGPDQRSGPINFFIYPLVEMDGRKVDGAAKTTFSYKDVR